MPECMMSERQAGFVLPMGLLRPGMALNNSEKPGVGPFALDDLESLFDELRTGCTRFAEQLVQGELLELGKDHLDYSP